MAVIADTASAHTPLNLEGYGFLRFWSTNTPFPDRFRFEFSSFSRDRQQFWPRHGSLVHLNRRHKQYMYVMPRATKVRYNGKERTLSGAIFCLKPQHSAANNSGCVVNGTVTWAQSHLSILLLINRLRNSSLYKSSLWYGVDLEIKLGSKFTIFGMDRSKKSILKKISTNTISLKSAHNFLKHRLHIDTQTSLSQPPRC